MSNRVLCTTADAAGARPFTAAGARITAGMAGLVAALCLGADASRAALVVAEGPLSFASDLLELPGKVRLTFYEDVDGDGLTDVLAVYEGSDRAEPPRNLLVFFQRPEGFAAQPDLRLRVPDAVAVIDLGDVVDSSPGQELLLLDGTGVFWVPLARPSEAAAPASDGPLPLADGTRLVTVDTVLAAADPDNLRKYDFAQPVDGARRATLFIPRTAGYRVFYPGDDYASGADIAVSHVHRVGARDESHEARPRMIYSVQPAAVHLADFDGDGLADFAVTHLDDVAIHRQRDGRFAQEPDLALPLRILTDVDRDAAEGVDALIDFKLADFDGDKLADIFVWKTVVQKKAVINDKQQYQLYRNRGFRFEQVPDQAFVLKSFDAASIADLDGNGQLDLVTGYFELSLSNIIKALLSKKLEIDLSFFLANAQGFPDRPDESRSFKIRFSLSNQDEVFAPAVDVKRDFDGNGVTDFLLQTDDEKLEVFLGQKSGGNLFEPKASVKLQTPACEDHFAGDMNGDGRADLAFAAFPDRAPFKTSWINVVLSQGAPRAR